MDRVLSKGFTIVELLIVVVVIAILASISVVAYTGVQDRANFARMKSDFHAIQGALEMYYIDNGEYPNSANCENRPREDGTGTEYNYESQWCGWDQGNDNSFIPGLAPGIIQRIPNQPRSIVSSRDTYLYQSRDINGNNQGTAQYQLMRFKDTGLSTAEKTNNPSLIGGDYAGIAWGVKSHPDSPWW